MLAMKVGTLLLPAHTVIFATLPLKFGEERAAFYIGCCPCNGRQCYSGLCRRNRHDMYRESSFSTNREIKSYAV